MDDYIGSVLECEDSLCYSHEHFVKDLKISSEIWQSRFGVTIVAGLA